MEDPTFILKAVEQGGLVTVVVLMYLSMRYLLTKLDKLDDLTAAMQTLAETMSECMHETRTTLTLLSEQSKRAEQELRTEIHDLVEIVDRGADK